MDKKTFSKGEVNTKSFSPKEKIITDEEMLKNLNDALNNWKSGKGIRWIN